MILQKLKIVFKIFLIVLFIYSALFSVVGTIAVLKARSCIYEVMDGVRDLKDNVPTMSRFMKDLRDSNPNVQIKHRFVPIDSISMNLQRAVIAAEDPVFYYHPGFNLQGIIRAFDVNMSSRKIVNGGSTITQQLAKNIFLTGERTLERKVKELGYALLMERELGKDRILELYLNYAQWGKDIFGCEAASQAYYHVSCFELSERQAVNLAAMLAAPCSSKPEMMSPILMRRRSVIYKNIPLILPPALENDSAEVDSLP